MYQVMFDIDGTLLESYTFDGQCYQEAVFAVLGHHIESDWSSYKHVTDSGILDQHLSRAGLWAQRDEIQRQVKSIFICKIATWLQRKSVKQIAGAAALIANLRANPQVLLCIATGGWAETARMKLDSAGIDATDIPLASANEHYARTEIMKLALQKCAAGAAYPCTYFGDGPWDRQACEALAINFVLVGNKIEYPQNMPNLLDIPLAYQFIGIQNS